MLEVKALEIAVVPGEVRVGDVGFDERLLGGVPEFVVSDEGGGCECKECDEKDNGLH